MVLSGAKGEQMNEGAQDEVCQQQEQQGAAAADTHAGRPRFLRRGGAGDGDFPAVHGSAVRDSFTGVKAPFRTRAQCVQYGNAFTFSMDDHIDVCCAAAYFASSLRDVVSAIHQPGGGYWFLRFHGFVIKYARKCCSVQKSYIRTMISSQR